MSSFLYYKNLTMAVNMVMLDKMHGSRPAQPVKYEANLPYNRTFAYNVFFLSAVLLLVIQQTMFYGMSMLTGTMREENRSFSIMPVQMKDRGISRTVAGRGAAYWLIYMAIGVYIAILTPAMFGMPRNSSFQDIFVLLLFYVSACVVFSMTFQFVHPPQGNRVRALPLHVSDMSLPDRILMAGKQLPGILESILMAVPVHVRRKGVHKHEYSRSRPCDGRTPACRPDHTGHRLLPALVPVVYR